MEQVIRTTPASLHPLLSVAAVSAIAFSVTGIVALTGYLPMHRSEPAVIAAPATSAASLAPATLPGDVPSGNTVVIQNNVAATPATSDTGEAPVKRVPRATRPAPMRTAAAAQAAAQATGSASAPVNHPVAVSSTALDAPPAPPPPAVAQAPVAQACANCGVVESIREVKQSGDASGVGAVAGGVGGAVVGKQFGKGHGNDLLTVLGAVGGAIAGHQVEKNVRSTVVYEVNVRMEDGSVRSFPQSTPPAWRPGERVRVDGSALSVI